MEKLRDHGFGDSLDALACLGSFHLNVDLIFFGNSRIELNFFSTHFSFFNRFSCLGALEGYFAILTY